MMFPIDYNGDVLNHNARVVVDGGIVESTDFLADFSEQTKRVNMPLLLDIYPNAAAAYSLRKLRTAYTGSAIRVRRSSDNTETDIGFNNAGDLDTSALATFVGNGNGFVSTWYDQSGNNRNATQTTQANQPIVVSGGTFFLEKNKPVIYANNRTKRMNIPSFTLVGDYSIIIASTLKSFGRNMWTGTLGLSGFVRALDAQADGFSIRHNGEVGGANFSGVQTLNPELHFFQRFGTNMSHSRNGVNNITTELSPQGTNFTINVLFDGYGIGGQNYMMDANAFEFIFYPTNQSPNRIGIETNINSYYRIYQQEALLLDYYPDAAAAYSLRKLRSGYTGAAIQVRRSSDNAVQNIGFDSNGGLDTTALTTFVGTGNTGFVTTWYDQSGNNRNATQTGTTNQPVIVSGGTLITTNSKPSLNFDGAGDTFTATITPLLSYTNMTTFIINNPAAAAAPDTQTSILFGVDQGGANIPQLGISVGGSTGLFTGEKFGMFFSSSTINSGRLGSSTYNHNANEQTLFSIFNLSSGFLAYKNNNFITFDLAAAMTTSTPCAPANTNASNPLFHIGTINGASNGTLQKFQEVIVYPSNQSPNRPFIEANINSYYNIYVSENDAQSFIDAAAITNSTQRQAINKLVYDLKAYGLWYKMKAIYPFVGGTAASHKFNLKDPRDVDGAFRLVFNGGWTHSATGAKPDGSTGWANTYFNPSLHFLNANNAHISIYQTTPLTTGANGGFNITSGVNATLFGGYVTGVDSRLNVSYSGSFLNGIPGFSNDGKGLFTLSKNVNNNIIGYKNGVLIGTGTGSTSGTPNLNLYLSARNANGSTDSFDNGFQKFVTFGDGLTDTEAANLYTAVQTFQTTLGRQV